jgi:hypothetical protein
MIKLDGEITNVFFTVTGAEEGGHLEEGGVFV